MLKDLTHENDGLIFSPALDVSNDAGLSILLQFTMVPIAIQTWQMQ